MQKKQTREAPSELDKMRTRKRDTPNVPTGRGGGGAALPLLLLQVERTQRSDYQI